jgi:hypothetical protein
VSGDAKAQYRAAYRWVTLVVIAAAQSPSGGRPLPRLCPAGTLDLLGGLPQHLRHPAANRIVA